MEVNDKVLTMLIKARDTWIKLSSNPTHWLRESIWSYSLSSKRVKPNLDGKSVFNNTKKPNIKLKSCPKQKMITQVKRRLRRGLHLEKTNGIADLFTGSKNFHRSYWLQMKRISPWRLRNYLQLSRLNVLLIHSAHIIAWSNWSNWLQHFTKLQLYRNF